MKTAYLWDQSNQVNKTLMTSYCNGVCLNTNRVIPRPCDMFEIDSADMASAVNRHVKVLQFNQALKTTVQSEHSKFT